MNAIVIGRRHQGKSTLAAWLARCFSLTTIVFDPNCQFQNFSPHSGDLEAFEKWLSGGPPWHSFVLTPTPGQVPEDFNAMVEALSIPRWPYKHFSLIIDESTCVQRPNGVEPGLERLIRQAPPSITIIQCGHRLTDINRLCRALATDVFVFQTISQPDREILEKEFAYEVAQQAPRLAQYVPIHYWVSHGGQRNYSIWRRTDNRYIDIGSANREPS